MYENKDIYIYITISYIDSFRQTMWVNHQVVDIVNLQQREKIIKIVYKIMDTTLPLQVHAE